MKFKKRTVSLVIGAGVVAVIGAAGLGYQAYRKAISVMTTGGKTLISKNQTITDLQGQLASISGEFAKYKTTDQVKRNDALELEIKNIQRTYGQAVTTYQNLTDLQAQSAKTAEEEKLFAAVLLMLSKQNYASASAKIAELDKKIADDKAKLAVNAAPAVNAPVNNAPPGAGYSRQTVSSDVGSFTVNIIAGTLGNTKIIVDTASDSDCRDNCPVLPLATYVARSGAYAGVNGTYFCPASYPTCAGKTNSFDLLVMNKNKHYLNSDNNVYSSNPGVIFGGSYIRFVTAASQWGRDTGIDGMLSNYPLLVFNNSITFGGDSDPKHGAKGGRSFVANKGDNVYIGTVLNATVVEAAHVLKTMGMENALNLDDGGSVALFSGGYKLGPGRDIPNAVLFVRK